MELLGTTAQARHEKLGDRLRANKTRRVCIVGLIVSWIFGSAILAFGISIYVNDGYIWNGINYIEVIGLLNGSISEVISLIIAMIVTLLNESMGYVHSTALRGSLQREGQLGFNSNLRLFSSSKNSMSNSTYIKG
ncbi:hypothetical protein BOTNAR_0406g00080 [Botryotinia narcissicola]|uniref:Uncharacterized protein n=1 Tax=Botryotinia narcissicola TaxID=278944 RepID=A0A4Z1HLW9_9HELO|nr:hypothetical protein BOTNAR_0406g00080 [Botryotinia narcissicola]